VIALSDDDDSGYEYISEEYEDTSTDDVSFDDDSDDDESELGCLENDVEVYPSSTHKVAEDDTNNAGYFLTTLHEQGQDDDGSADEQGLVENVRVVVETQDRVLEKSEDEQQRKERRRMMKERQKKRREKHQRDMLMQRQKAADYQELRMRKSLAQMRKRKEREEKEEKKRQEQLLRIKQQQARQEQIKQQRAKKLQAKQEQARKQQEKLEQARKQQKLVHMQLQQIRKQELDEVSPEANVEAELNAKVEEAKIMRQVFKERSELLERMTEALESQSSHEVSVDWTLGNPHSLVFPKYSTKALRAVEQKNAFFQNKHKSVEKDRNNPEAMKFALQRTEKVMKRAHEKGMDLLCTGKLKKSRTFRQKGRVEQIAPPSLPTENASGESGDKVVETQKHLIPVNAENLKPCSENGASDEEAVGCQDHATCRNSEKDFKERTQRNGQSGSLPAQSNGGDRFVCVKPNDYSEIFTAAETCNNRIPSTVKDERS